MSAFFRPGPQIFGVALLFFGVQQFFLVAWSTGPIPGPPWLSGSVWSGCTLGIILLACGACIATGVAARWAAALLAAVLGVRAMVLYLPGLIMAPHRPGNWTSAFELLAMAGASLVALSLLKQPKTGSSGLNAAVRTGQIVFAVSLIIFGIQHFLYAPFIATLITPWIPAKLFWAYFVGAAFLAAAASILARRITQLATALLGTMFLLWFFILHLPRVVLAAKNGNEWTSAFVALAMGGAALILGKAEAKEKEMISA